MQTIRTQADVLVVGAGPTGLTLSAELIRRGIDVLTVDKFPAGLNTSRAAVIHARTLEVLEPLDVVPALMTEGLQVPIFRIRDRDRTLLTLDFAEIPSQYAFTLMCPQNRTESILLARLQGLGGNVVRPAEVTGLRVGPERVDADVVLDGSVRTVSARWVVGCDGMHSRVRENAGIAFSGDAYEQVFVLADVHMDWPLARSEVNLFFSPAGLVVVAPLPQDRYRIVATVDQAPEHPTIADMQTLLDTRGPRARPARIRDSIWSSRFRLHHRVADTPRQGRVLLCGDAAHVHSPAGGQGMNTGIQDAMSLAATLTSVLAGANESELDAWADARHHVAAEVVTFTDRMTRVATVGSPALRSLRNAAINAAGHVPFLTHVLARKIAELDSSRDSMPHAVAR